MTLDALKIRRRLGREVWDVPIPWMSLATTGWRFLSLDERGQIKAEILISEMTVPDPEGTLWIHASMVRRAPAMPSHEDLALLKYAVWRDEGEAYQVFAAAERHVNIHNGALHLWGRADGTPALPDLRSWNPETNRWEV